MKFRSIIVSRDSETKGALSQLSLTSPILKCNLFYNLFGNVVQRKIYFNYSSGESYQLEFAGVVAATRITLNLYD